MLCALWWSRGVEEVRAEHGLCFLSRFPLGLLDQSVVAVEKQTQSSWLTRARCLRMAWSTSQVWWQNNLLLCANNTIRIFIACVHIDLDESYSVKQQTFLACKPISYVPVLRSCNVAMYSSATHPHTLKKKQNPFCLWVEVALNCHRCWREARISCHGLSFLACKKKVWLTLNAPRPTSNPRLRANRSTSQPCHEALRHHLNRQSFSGLHMTILIEERNLIGNDAYLFAGES